jgi:hypothetical protein
MALPKLPHYISQDNCEAMESTYTRTSADKWMTRKALPGRSFIHFMQQKAI